MIYLASPYSHPDPAIRQQRFRAACVVAAALLRAGHTAFSPIVHGHPLIEHGLPTDWQFWEHWGREMLVRCDGVAVLQLDGWIDSVGVQAEIALARSLAKPLEFVEPSLLKWATTPTLAFVAAEVAT
ncbi:MAG TPA: DUF1937 family protein [Gemmataceae bacterium]|nr:DUF1937 family protein [Gemmataceae bacterium]